MKRLFIIMFLLVAVTASAGVNLDKGDDHIIFGQPAILDFTPNTDEFTICVWIDGLNDDGTIIGKANATSANRQYQIFSTGVERYAAAVVGGTTLSTDEVIGDGSPHIVCLKNYDDTGTKKAVFHIDGVEDNAVITSGSATNAFDVLIGARRGADNTDVGFLYGGTVTEVAIWDEALADYEFVLLASSRLKRMPLQVSAANLVALWALDDLAEGGNLAGATFKDMSGQGNDGTGDDDDASGGQGEAEKYLSYP